MFETFDPELAVAPLVGVYLLLFGAIWWTVQRFATLRERYFQVFARCNLTGMAAADRMIADQGLVGVAVQPTAQQDQYDWRTKEVKLRSDTAVSASVGALATAAHEVGHALQFSEDAWSARMWRWALYAARIALVFVPVAVAWGVYVGNFSQGMTAALVLGGAVLALRAPVVIALELDANRRARKIVRRSGLLADDEVAGFDSYLRAGFHTHAALAVFAPAVLVAAVWFTPSVFAWDERSSPFEPLQVTVAPTNPTPARFPPIDAAEHAAALRTIETLDLTWTFLQSAAIVGVFVWWMTRRRAAGKLRGEEENNLGLIHYQNGALDRALAELDKAVARNPELAEAYYNRAFVKIAKADVPGALADLEILFRLSDKKTEKLRSLPDVWLLRGKCRAALDDFAGAEKDFDEALARPNPPAETWRDRGLARLKLGRHREAIADADMAIEKDRADAVAYNNRGFSYMQLGETEAAKADFERAILLDPKFENPRKHLATWEASVAVERSLAASNAN